jgi:hypothetical protein
LLNHPTLDQLHTLGLHGMAKAFVDLADAGQAKDLAHADWLALLLDREGRRRTRFAVTKKTVSVALRHQTTVGVDHLNALSGGADGSAIRGGSISATRGPSRRASDADGRQRAPDARLSGRDVTTYPGD